MIARVVPDGKLRHSEAEPRTALTHNESGIEAVEGRSGDPRVPIVDALAARESESLGVQPRDPLIPYQRVCIAGARNHLPADRPLTFRFEVTV